MALVAYEAYAYRMLKVMPDQESIPFVAKIQRAKTRKNKDYFVLRTTLPKGIAEKIGARAGDYLFFKAKKAQWYHMLDWEAMENTWRMLPDDFKNRVIMDGLYKQSYSDMPSSLGATNAAMPLVQTPNMQKDRAGGLPWK